MPSKFRQCGSRIFLTVFAVSITILVFGKGWNTTTKIDVREEQFRDSERTTGEFFDVTHFASIELQANYLERIDHPSPGVDAQIVSKSTEHLPSPLKINLAVVVCGDRLNDSMIMMKSAMTFTTTPIHFIVMADNKLQSPIRKQLNDWTKQNETKITYEVLDINFPVKSGADEWRKLFKPCASQRLFLPTLLDKIDSLLYVDTDVVFLRPLDDVWSFFYRMNSSQIAALTPEHEDFTTGWYNRFAKHPFYGPLGVNSGVMLMNLTRMRQIHWQQLVMPIYKKYKFKITWGDQDIINIVFHNHPDMLYVMPCEWNYRPDHCMYLSVCKTATKYGVSIMHGNRGVFKSNKQPAFKVVYEAFDNYRLGSNLAENLLKPMQNGLLETENTNCGKLRKIFTKQLVKFIYAPPHR